MYQTNSIEAAIALAEQRWIGLQFRRKTAQEAESCCPDCGGKDRFIVFSDPPRFWCRQCNMSGFLENSDPSHRLTEAEITEIRLKRLERKQDEHDSRISALERMAHCHDHERYHKNAVTSEQAWQWFTDNGLFAYTIYDYQIGFCPRCPTDREGRPSYTFPIWRKDGPLWSIRHRLIGSEQHGKYRPHVKNLGLQLVNARYLSDWNERVILVEGCKKARVIAQHDIPVVGILGKGGFEMRWLSWFHPAASICVALDPDAQESADELARGIAATGKDAYVARFPEKPDDLLAGGMRVDDWMAYVHWARRAG